MPSGGGRRIEALIIANSAYGRSQRLPNAATDGETVQKALIKAGVTAPILLFDLDVGSFNTAISSFSKRAAGADIALIYFAGHGMELGGTNWLLPVDAHPETEYELKAQAIQELELLHCCMGAKVRLVVLDACRDNPFSAQIFRTVPTRDLQIGLSNPDVQENYSMIIHAASRGQRAFDGKAGQGSPFANAFAKYIVRPGLELRYLTAHIAADVREQTGGAQKPVCQVTLDREEVYIVPPEAPAEVTPPKITPPFRSFEQVLYIQPEATIRPFKSSDEVVNSLEPSVSRAHNDSPRSHTTANNEQGRSANSDEQTRKFKAPKNALAFDLIDIAFFSLAGIFLLGGAALLWASLSKSPDSGVFADRSGAAEVALADSLRFGSDGNKIDYPAAIAHLEKAVSLGNNDARASLAYMIDNGQGTKRDSKKAAALNMTAAKGGNAMAQHNLAVMYELGQGGLPKSDLQAREWFKRAADQNFTQSRLAFASFLASGRGGEKNVHEAVKVYREILKDKCRCSAKERATAALALGDLFADSSDSELADPAESKRMHNNGVAELAAASAQGDNEAAVRLARILRWGLYGQAQDKNGSQKLLKEASAKGYADATLELADGYLNWDFVDPKEVQNPDGFNDTATNKTAFKFLQLAVDQGSIRAMSRLGEIYCGCRQGIPKDDAKAVLLFERAAIAEDSVGQLRLGEFYAQGRGGKPVDKVQARRLFELSAAQGNQDAQKRLSEIM